MDLKKRECKKCVFVFAAVVVLIVVVAGFLVYQPIIGGVSWPVDANRQFKSASFSCANGANSQLESKNCRSAAFWNNFATKFCRDLCEVSPDMSIDNNANMDPACALSSLRLFKECEGNVVQPVAPGSVEVGGDCTEDAECVSGNCEGEPYGVCGEMPITETVTEICTTSPMCIGDTNTECTTGTGSGEMCTTKQPLSLSSVEITVKVSGLKSGENLTLECRGTNLKADEGTPRITRKVFDSNGDHTTTIEPSVSSIPDTPGACKTFECFANCGKKPLCTMTPKPATGDFSTGAAVTFEVTCNPKP